MGRGQFSFLPVSLILKDKMELLVPWRNFPGATTIVIAGEDEIIPRAQTVQYLAATNARVSVVEFAHIGHNDVELDEAFWREILQSAQK
jgi:hypothetical protein